MAQRESVDTRRAQLVDAAVAIICSEGLARLSTRRVADAAGVPLSTVHYCFQTKHALLHACLVAMVGSEVELMMAAARRGRGPAAILRKGLAAISAHARQQPGAILAHTELSVHSLRHPEAADLVRVQYEALIDAMAALLKLALAPPATPPRRPVAQLAAFLAASIDGLSMQQCVGVGALRDSEQVDLLVAAVLHLARTEG